MEQAAAAPHGLEHEDTTTGLSHRKLLMWAFLGSDCMFFGSLIATYIVYKGKSEVGPFPEDVFSIPTTSVSTFVLLMSSMSMVLAYSALTRGTHKGLPHLDALDRYLGHDVPGVPDLRVQGLRESRGTFRVHEIGRRA